MLKGIPTLVGLGEGAQLLIDLFLKIREIEINGQIIPVLSKHVQAKNHTIGINDELYTYKFETLWMALNQKNYALYLKSKEEEKPIMLKKIAVANILAFYKACNLYLNPDERILLQLKAGEKATKFKNQDMLAFEGSFTTNALLPDYIGLGKSTSRGFGTIFIEH